ncbi:PepSY domain-containing protein [Roseateles sp.]|uniref:PepSY domain-containing protein n=1 Tax=Roseateles sp. TaxID=1971397 RepID=UPI0025EE0811|nr:PepSY domain-containing protein [Roseateles sp.]MBV8036153.1 PepSY domain-containing protein [Roseateles sp.]
MKVNLRSPLLFVHRWTGMTLGLLFLFLALTGLTLVFRGELGGWMDTSLHGDVECRAPQPLDALIEKARAVRPDAEVQAIRVRDDGQSVIVRMSDRHDLYVGPCSGRVMDRNRWAGVFGLLEQLHRFRFLESADAGNFITGGAAMAMLFAMGFGGLFVLWPSSWRQLKTVTTPRPHLRGRALDLNLHRSIGFYTATVIVIVSITALPMAFKWTRTVINVAVGSPTEKPPKLRSTPVAGAQVLDAGALWEQVRPLLEHPDTTPHEISIELPRKPNDAAVIYAVEIGAAHPNARSYYYLDAYSGKLLRAEPYATSPLGNRIYRYTSSLHSGEVGGLPVQLLFFTGIAGVPVLAYTGLRSFFRRRRRVAAAPPPLRLRVAEMRDVAQDIRCFVLIAIDGGKLPPFTAGAHVDVLTGSGLVRQYSLCNDTAERHRYVIAVKRTADSRGGSVWMHDEVRVGDELAVGRPRNHFELSPRAGHHMLLAAGIGITPLLSMARELMRRGEPFTLHYFARSPEQMAFHEELSASAFQSKVFFHYAVQRSGLGERLRQMLWHHAEDAHLYVCGPRGFMDLVESTASATWAPEMVHVEHFGAAPLALAGERHPFTIELRRSGSTLQVPAEQTITDVLRAHGLEPFTSCEQGVCGSCLTVVLAGRPDHRDAFLSPAERKACNKIMVCVSRAKSENLVLDL